MSAKADEKLEQTLRRTSALIRRVEAGAAFLSVAAAALFLLLGGILLDHHFADGLSEKARCLYALISSLILLAVSLWRFYPLVRYRINPLYSAWKVESAHPNLKNGLLNWFLRRGQQPTPFDRALSRKTAEAIPPHAESDSVEMKPLVRAAMLLIAAMTLLALNLVTSEKSGFVSAARVLLPTAPIAAPEQVVFRAVEPGNISCNPGERITIRAEFADSPGGGVFLVYGTADGRTGEKRLAMEETGYHTYSVLFPDSEEGLSEDIRYRVVVAGGEKVSASSAGYCITVLPPILLTPIKVLYRYPSYTGLPPETREGEGAVSAWEGTEAVITARCTRPMSGAFFIPDGALRLAKKMTVSPDDPALAEFALTLGAETCSSYRLRAVDTGRNANFTDDDGLREAPSWEIETLPDPAPIAVWGEDVPQQTSVAEHGTLPLTFTLSDELFGLSGAGLDITWWPKTRPEEKKSFSIDLSGQLERLGTDRRVPVTISFDLVPAANGIPPRAAMECRGYAVDNRPNEPNRGETAILAFSVAEDGTAPEKTDPGAADTQQEGKEEGNQGDSSQGKKQENQDGEGENGQENPDSGNTGKDGDSSEDEPQEESSSPQPQESSPDGGTPDQQEGTEESAGEPAGSGGEAQSRSGAAGEPNGGQTDSGSGENRGGAGNASGEEGSSGENAAGGDRQGGEGNQPDGLPIDAESNPAEAFEAILDFSGLDVESAPSDAEPQGRGTGVASPDTEKKNADVSEEDLDKIKSVPGGAPNGGERRTDPGKSGIPADAQRENGAVDPAARNYLITEGDTNGEAPVPRDANLQTDPLLNPQHTEETPASGNEGEQREGNPAGGSPDAGSENRFDPGVSADAAGEPNGDAPGSSAAQPGEEKNRSGDPLSGGTGSAAGEDRGREAAPADKTNLLYTEKATNLVLNYLDEQLDRGADPRLLERLGWNEEEQRLFHERWTEMKKRAKTDSAARRRYEEELRDMGMRPEKGKGVSLSGRAAGEKTPAAARSVLRVPPPPAYHKRLQEYNKAISGAGELP